MKPELTNLLDRLVTEGQTGRDPRIASFQSLIVTPQGAAIAVYRHGAIPFRNLAELEQFAYTGQLPAADVASPARTSAPSALLNAPSV